MNRSDTERWARFPSSLGEELDERDRRLADAVTASGEAPTIVVHGPAGVGRTTALVSLEQWLTASGVDVASVRCLPDGRAAPLAYPGLQEPGHAGARARPGRVPDWSPIGARTRPAPVPDRPVALLVDDVQWAGDHVLSALAAFARSISASGARCICFFRTPGSHAFAGGTPMAELRASGFARSVRLRPFTRRETGVELAAALGAVPASDLVDRAQHATRGLPAVLADWVVELHERGAVAVIDGRAYVVPLVDETPPSREPSRVPAAVRWIEPELREVAAVTAMLTPLGAAVPALVGRVGEVDADRTADRLAALVDLGVLHRSRGGSVWRFPVPAVAAALLAGLAPTRRRRAAVAAVEAVLGGYATVEDPDDLADLVIAAGRLVEPARARAVLVDRANARDLVAPERAARWWRAAADLSATGTEVGEALFRQAEACIRHGDLECAVDVLHAVLRHHVDGLTCERTVRAQVRLIRASDPRTHRAALQEVLRGGGLEPRVEAAQPVLRAFAAAQLDDWDQAHRILADARPTWRSEPITRELGTFLAVVSGAWTGRTGAPRFGDVDPGSAAPGRPDPQLDPYRGLMKTLLVMGERHEAERLVTQVGASWFDQSHHALLAAMRGDFETSAELSRRAVSMAGGRAREGSYTFIRLWAAADQLAQGRFGVLRVICSPTRISDPAIGHLLAVPSAILDRYLGNAEAAELTLRAALRRADEQGLMVGTELLLLVLVELLCDRGDTVGAQRALVRADAVAARMPTWRPQAHALLARATVERDARLVREAARLCREQGTPYEFALSIQRVAEHGLAEPDLLHEAYTILAGQRGLYFRARLRMAMTASGMSIPGRQAVVAENERLLGRMVADGLGNRQIAHALGTSEKSVEGRLSRLYLRTGHRSRQELAGALTAEEGDRGL